MECKSKQPREHRPAVKDVMGKDASVIAQPQWGGIDGANPRARASPLSLEVHRKGGDYSAGKLCKAVVRNQSRKQIPQGFLHLGDVKFFEGKHPEKMEEHRIVITPERANQARLS